MANYVNRTILCQAYLHIDDMNLSDEKQQEFAQDISEFTIDRGRHFFTKHAEVDVRHKDGSEIFYITMTLGSGGLYAAIAKYPSFREGVIVLAKDAYRFTEGLISESLFRLGSRQFDAIRIESRAGIFMRFQNCIHGLEAIGRRLHTGGIQSLERGTKSMIKYCENTLRQIENAEDRVYARGKLREIAAINLPARLPANRKAIKGVVEIGKYKQARRALLASLDRPDGAHN